MAERSWPTKGLRILVPITGVAIVIQFFLGIWTNVYGPSAGFTSNTSFPALDWHYNVGYVLGVLAILGVIFSVLSRKVGYIGVSVVVLLAIVIAGFAGGAFVGSSPNDPAYSVVMALAFLVAFAANLSYGFLLRWGPPGPMASAAA